MIYELYFIDQTLKAPIGTPHVVLEADSLEEAEYAAMQLWDSKDGSVGYKVVQNGLTLVIRDMRSSARL